LFVYGLNSCGGVDYPLLVQHPLIILNAVDAEIGPSARGAHAARWQRNYGPVFTGLITFVVLFAGGIKRHVGLDADGRNTSGRSKAAFWQLRSEFFRVGVLFERSGHYGCELRWW
jgi:hypothetical protein